MEQRRNVEARVAISHFMIFSSNGIPHKSDLEEGKYQIAQGQTELADFVFLHGFRFEF